MSEKLDVDRGFLSIDTIGQQGHHTALGQDLGDFQHDLGARLVSIDHGLPDVGINGFQRLGHQRVLVAIHDHLEPPIFGRSLATVSPDGFEATQMGAKQQASASLGQGQVQLIYPLGTDRQSLVSPRQHQNPVDDCNGKGMDMNQGSRQTATWCLDMLQPVLRGASLGTTDQQEIQAGGPHAHLRESAANVQNDPADQQQPEAIAALGAFTPLGHGDTAHGPYVARCPRESGMKTRRHCR